MHRRPHPALRTASTLALLLLVPAFALAQQDCLDYDDYYPGPAPLAGGLLGQGSAEGVLRSGDTLFLATSTGITSFDVSDPAAPRALDRIAVPGSRLAASGTSLAVIHYENDLQIVDVSDPADMRVAGSLPLPDMAWDVVAKGVHLYVTYGPWGGGFLTVDISHPEQPVQVGDLFLVGGSRMAVAGAHLFLVGPYIDTFDSVVLALDVSDPADPSIVFGEYYYGGGLVDIAVDWPYAYVADAFNPIRILDISDPAAIEQVGWIADSGPSRSVTVQGALLHATFDTPAYPESEVAVVGLDDPLDPQILGRVTVPHVIWDLAAVGTTIQAACASDGLRVIDASQSSDPVLLPWDGTPGLSGYVQDVAMSATHAYLVNQLDLQVIDLGTLPAPALVATQAMGAQGRCVHLDGSTLFWGDQATGEGTNGRLKILDASEPESPVVLGAVGLPGPPLAVASDGDYAYAVSQIEGLVVVDLADPTAPALVGGLNPPGLESALARVGDHVFIATSTALHAVDVSDPSAPQLAGTLELSTPANDVVCRGEIALVADAWDGHLFLVDISDPTALSILSTVNGPYSTRRVTYLEPYAYAIDANDGVWIVDLASVDEPTVVGWAPVPGAAVGLDACGSLVGVACSGHGFHLAWTNCDGLLSVEPETGDMAAPLWVSAHPNPFNPVTRLDYAVASEGHVRLRVFDLRGRAVTTLVDGVVAAGRHQVVWNGRDAHGCEVPSGVYLSRLETAGQVAQGRMALVR